MRHVLTLSRCLCLLLIFYQSAALAEMPTSQHKSTDQSIGAQPTLASAAVPSPEITVETARDLKWAGMFYMGWQTGTTMLHLAEFEDIRVARAKLYSLALSYQLDKDGFLRRLLRCLVHSIELVGNVTYQDDPAGNIFQFNPHLLFRWYLCSNSWTRVSFAIGEGVSYSDKVPHWEKNNIKKAQDSRRFLNYVTYELGFSIPKYPQWEIMYRVHHRSGVFGLYCNGRISSTAIGVAIRYRF